MFYRLILLLFTGCFLFLFSACSPEGETGESVYSVLLDQSIRNLTGGYYRRHYAVEDTVLWQTMMDNADTIIPRASAADRLKFRTKGIWYEAKPGPEGWLSNQQYPGWVPYVDSLDQSYNLMTMDNRQYMQVEIAAADLVLNGDSIRLGIIHPIGPAYDWNFQEYTPQLDHLVLTTYGNDTLPISRGMDAVGPITRQTIFRVGRHSYVLRSLSPAYDEVIIEELTDSRGLPYAAELDLNYRPVPVDDLNHTATSIRRTPGKELILFFWLGFDDDGRVRKIDSLYQALPASEKEALEIALLAHFRNAESLEAWAQENKISLPLYTKNNKTCKRLNCIGRFPYYARVNKRGKIVSFYEGWETLEERLKR